MKCLLVFCARGWLWIRGRCTPVGGSAFLSSDFANSGSAMSSLSFPSLKLPKAPLITSCCLTIQTDTQVGAQIPFSRWSCCNMEATLNEKTKPRWTRSNLLCMFNASRYISNGFTSTLDDVQSKKHEKKTHRDGPALNPQSTNVSKQQVLTAWIFY